jgi:hypothetical protein
MSDFARIMEVGRASTPAPVNTDAPAIMSGGDVATTATQGSILNCTMGNWDGMEPGSYDYRWRRDGTDLGVSGAGYIVREEDAGHTLDCNVTATNLGGSTAVASHGVSVGDPASRRRTSHE